MFTKGKWQVGYNDGSGRFGKHKGAYSSSVTCANHLLATVWHHDEDDYPKDHPIMIAKANAHLIAAAPDLYEALKDMVQILARGIAYENGEPAYYNGPIDELSNAMTKANEILIEAEGKS